VTLVIVEGESDRAALETLADRLGATIEVVSVGGSKGVRREAALHPGERLIGLVDIGERRDFERVLDEVYVCDLDLEDELVRAVGAAGVEAVIDSFGHLSAFRKAQLQPAQRVWSVERQLRRFLDHDKAGYAAALAAVVPIERIPAPLLDVIRAAGTGAESA
jgi:hypothetical protein